MLLVFNAAFAEITVDSLIQQIENTHKIDKKTELLYQLGIRLADTKPDTALFVANVALRLSADK